MRKTLSPALRRARLWIAVSALGIALPVLAHHGWTGYLQDDFTLAGSVEAATLGNPHGLIKLRAGDGKMWDVVLGPPANQRRAGLTEDLVPKGAQATAHGHRHQDPNRLEIKTERLVVDGRTFDIYPDRS